MNQYEKLYTRGEFSDLLEVTNSDLTSAEAKYWNVTALWRLGLFEQAIEMGIEFSNKIEHNDIEWKAKMLHRLGSVYHGLAELEISQEYYQKSLALKEIVGDQEEISATLNNMGIIHYDKGEFDLALKYYERSLEIKMNNDSHMDIAPSINNIALVYRTMGEYDKALEKFKECLNINTKNGNIQDISYSLQNIGKIYRDKGQYEKAISIFEQSLDLRLQVGHVLNIAEMYMDLIVTILENNQSDTVSNYFDELTKITEETNNRKIQLFHKYCNALIKKSSKRSREKARAQIIFEDLIQYNDFDFYLQVKIYAHLVELLIYEYKSYEEEDVLDEINAYIARILHVVRSQNMYATLLEVLMLQSRLDTVQNQYDLAYQKLEEAFNIANERNMNKYVNLIEQERDRLRNNISDLKDVIDNSSISSKLEHLAVVDYIKLVQRARK